MEKEKEKTDQICFFKKEKLFSCFRKLKYKMTPSAETGVSFFFFVSGRNGKMN